MAVAADSSALAVSFARPVPGPGKSSSTATSDDPTVPGGARQQQGFVVLLHPRTLTQQRLLKVPAGAHLARSFLGRVATSNAASGTDADEGGIWETRKSGNVRKTRGPRKQDGRKGRKRTTRQPRAGGDGGRVAGVQVRAKPRVWDGPVDDSTDVCVRQLAFSPDSQQLIGTTSDWRCVGLVMRA